MSARLRSQAEELDSFYKEKFTKLGLYNYLATTLTRLHRQAFNLAVQMADLAAEAYKFETNESDYILPWANFWDSTKAGLLSGEQLMLALLNLEKDYLEQNRRSQEITQSFSLAQIHPLELMNLRDSGLCHFNIPEFFFDLYYPGQYRRLIKSVRLSIPAVTGPYTNVSATLELTGSEIRLEADLDSALIDRQLVGTSTVATSSAQNDGGVFEMNFRDERYLPFEGNGAISSWALSLPKSFRPFDYQTISDVILHISYTAEYDSGYRDEVEAEMHKVEDALVKFKEPMHRLFSLRSEFAQEFRQLVQSNEEGVVKISFEDKHFPLFIPFNRLFPNSF